MQSILFLKWSSQCQLDIGLEDSLRPAEEGEDDVGGEGRESRQGDRDTDHPRPERAVIAAEVKF